MPLTSPAVSEAALEKSVSTLFNEWLTGYFDGGDHAVGNNGPIAFPEAIIKFQQAAIPQPLNGTLIQMIWLAQGRPRFYWDNVDGLRQQLAWFDVTWMFLIRSQLQESGTGNAKMAVRDASDLLFGLLQNSASTRPLAQKGIHKLRPHTPQLVTQDAGYLMRSITCMGRLRYHVISQPTT